MAFVLGHPAPQTPFKDVHILPEDPGRLRQRGKIRDAHPFSRRVRPVGAQLPRFDEIDHPPASGFFQIPSHFNTVSPQNPRRL